MTNFPISGDAYRCPLDCDNISIILLEQFQYGDLGGSMSSMCSGQASHFVDVSIPVCIG